MHPQLDWQPAEPTLWGHGAYGKSGIGLQLLKTRQWEHKKESHPKLRQEVAAMPLEEVH